MDGSGVMENAVICNCCEKPTREPIYHAEEGDAYCGECVASLLGAEIKALTAGLQGLASMIDYYFAQKYDDGMGGVREPDEADPACHLWNAANAVDEDPGNIKTWLYAEHEPLDGDDAERALIAAGEVLAARKAQS